MVAQWVRVPSPIHTLGMATPASNPSTGAETGESPGLAGHWAGSMFRERPCRKGRQPGMIEHDTLSLDTIPSLTSVHTCLMPSGTHTHTLINYHLKGKNPNMLPRQILGLGSRDPKTDTLSG